MFSTLTLILEELIKECMLFLCQKKVEMMIENEKVEMIAFLETICLAHLIYGMNCRLRYFQTNMSFFFFLPLFPVLSGEGSILGYHRGQVLGFHLPLDIGPPCVGRSSSSEGFCVDIQDGLPTGRRNDTALNETFKKERTCNHPVLQVSMGDNNRLLLCLLCKQKVRSRVLNNKMTDDLITFKLTMY